MSRARQLRWLCGSALTVALLMSLCVVWAQDAERAADDSLPQRGGRRGRGTAGVGPIRFGADAERSAEGAAGFQRESIDTSRNQSEVYRASYIPVNLLATTLERHFRGNLGISLIAEATSNSLLISAPPERIKDLVDTIHKLDRAPKSVNIEVIFLDLPAVEDANEIAAKTFYGASPLVQKKIAELKKQGHVQRVRRFRLTAVDHQVASLQAGGDRANTSAQAQFFPGGMPGGRGGANAARSPAFGTTVQCTSRISPDGGPIVMELVIHDTPANRDGQPVSDVIASQFQGTLSVPTGMTLVAGDITTETENGPSRVIILVSAEAIAPPAE